MYRKTNDNALASKASVALPLDSSTAQTKRRNRRMPQSSNNGANSASQTRTPNSTSDDNSSEQSSKGNAVAAESDSNNDDDADDEEDDEVAEPAVLALSGVDRNVNDNQAGLLSEEFHGFDDGSAEEKTQVREDEDGVRRGRSLRSSKAGNAKSDVDDDDYNAVDLISDNGDVVSEDEDGWPNVERIEEQSLIEDFKQTEAQTKKAIMVSLSDEDSWQSKSRTVVDPNVDDILFSDGPYFEEQYGRTTKSVLAEEIHAFNPISDFDVPILSIETKSSRRVRFATPVRPFPGDADVGSYDQDLSIFFPSGPQQDVDVPRFDVDDQESSGSSSGYETDDDGSTTEEDEHPLVLTKAPKSLLLRQPSWSPSMSTPSTPASASMSFKIPSAPASHRRRPYMHSFVPDSRKALALPGRTGDRVDVYEALRPAPFETVTESQRNSGINTPVASSRRRQPTLVSGADFSDNDFSDFASSQVSTDPVLGAGTGPAMNNLLDASAPQRASGVDNALYNLSYGTLPFFPQENMGNLAGSSDASEYEALDISDYVDFGDDSSDDEVAQAELPADLVQKITQISSSAQFPNDLMAHFDKGVIGAFKQSQHPPVAPTSPPHNGLYSHGHAIKGGRQAAANAPLSPPTKRKASDALGSDSNVGPAPKIRAISALNT